MELKMTAQDLRAFLDEAFPQVDDGFQIERITPEGILIRLRVGDQHLRPGGTVSGPAMFGLADVAMYLAILARLGPVALAVTTNCSIDFMRKPAGGVDLLGEARILKFGSALVVGDVLIRSDGSADVVARASMTYAIPRR